MGDAGEGLVDAESRFQERLAEREQERQQRAATVPVDPERKRRSDSLELARTDLKRQASVTQNPMRKDQIKKALHDIERELSKL